MIPNIEDYKTITVISKKIIGLHIKTTYTTPISSFFNFFSVNIEPQKYPIVSKIDEESEAYKNGLRIGHKIIKLNGYSLAYKDIKTVLSDFIYEKKTSDFLILTIM